MGLKNISTLIVNPNKSALLILPTALSDNFQKSLQAATNCPNIVIAPHQQKKPWKPTFSVVIRNILLDITPDDITTLCPSLSIVKAWRIISRKTDGPMTLIRVLTTNKDTIDDMLINGVELFGRTFECETSNSPTPTPIRPTVTTKPVTVVTHSTRWHPLRSTSPLGAPPRRRPVLDNNSTRNRVIERKKTGNNTYIWRNFTKYILRTRNIIHSLQF
jgi:hypothetical protein